MNHSSFRLYPAKPFAAASLAILALTAFSLRPLAAQTVTPTDSGFILSAGDVVDVTYFYQPELNMSLQVRPDGLVSFPLVGDLKLAGRSITAVNRELKERYKPELAEGKNDVVVNVKSYARRKVFVSGEVNRPGSMAIPGDMTVFEAIVEAGGIRPTGNRKIVYLLRRGSDGNPVLQEVSLDVPVKLAVGQAPMAKAPAGTLFAAMTVLEPFDVVLVPESKVSRANRWVDQHIRQMIPALITAGFSYLFNPIAVR
jgi:polysaccharide export outer membrane protein